MDTIDHLVTFNETADSPPRRLVLKFIDGKYAVILLNDAGLLFVPYIDRLVGQTLHTAKNPVIGPVMETNALALPEVVNEDKVNKVVGGSVYLCDDRLVVACHSKTIKNTSTGLNAIGLVITGNQSIPDNEICSVHILSKSTPTPFISDEFGDSFSNNFDTEPRIIESCPRTVFTAIECIMDSALNALHSGNLEIAAKKYQKAFHYCHKYYPEHLDDTDLETATKLKTRSLLNLAAVGLKLNGQWLSSVIESCDFLLAMPETEKSSLVKAKALYRRGMAKLKLNDDVLAKRDFQESLALKNDPATVKAVILCDDAAKSRSSQLQQRMRSAFS